jgi:hypothetical protein
VKIKSKHRIEKVVEKEWEINLEPRGGGGVNVVASCNMGFEWYICNLTVNADGKLKIETYGGIGDEENYCLDAGNVKVSRSC